MSKFIASSYVVSGLSMHSTFANKDRVIFSKIPKIFNHLNKGYVIVFHEDKEHDYIKRLIGKPGDIVKYKNDNVYVNSKK